MTAALLKRDDDKELQLLTEGARRTNALADSLTQNCSATINVHSSCVKFVVFHFGKNLDSGFLGRDTV